MQQATMLYDGHCVLCQGSKRFIERLDWRNRVEMLDAQDRSLIKERYPELSYEDLMGAVHVVTADDEVKSGYFAVRYLTRFLPLLWPVLPFLYLPGTNWLGPKVYNWVARRRYKLNRLAGRPVCEDGLCKIPGVE